MMTHDQASLTSKEHAAQHVRPNFAVPSDDPCARIHLYQQQLRAELLAAAGAERAHRAAVRWPSLRMSPVRPGVAGDAVRAFERAVSSLTEAGISYVWRPAMSLVSVST